MISAMVALVVTSTLLGLVVGSFLNVVVYRVPAGLSVSKPRSACPSCGRQLSARDNIPLVSWVVLKGRCRSCSAAISIRYPAIEALTGLLFAAAALRFGWSPTTAAMAVFFAGLVALGAIDLERMLLPRRIVYVTGVLTATIIVLAAVANGQWIRLAVAGGSGVVAFSIFFGLNRVNPAWLGFGDVRLAGLIGTAVGWLGASYVVCAFLVANVAGVAVMVTLMSLGRANRRTKMPYGVFLAAGAIVAVFAGAGFADALHPGA